MMFYLQALQKRDVFRPIDCFGNVVDPIRDPSRVSLPDNCFVPLSIACYVPAASTVSYDVSKSHTFSQSLNPLLFCVMFLL